MSMDGAADSRVKPELLRDTFKLIDFEPQEVYQARNNRTLNPSRSQMKQQSTIVRPVNNSEFSENGSKAQFFDKRNPQKSVSRIAEERKITQRVMSYNSSTTANTVGEYSSGRRGQKALMGSS